MLCSLGILKPRREYNIKTGREYRGKTFGFSRAVVYSAMKFRIP